MSNSIWHKYDIKDIPNPHHEILAWTGSKHAVVIIKPAEWRSGDCDWIESWAYMQDIITQADKAERLQKALCFIRNIRGAGMSYQDMFLDAHEVAKTALDPEHKPILCGRYDEEMLDLIKQLIKE